MCQSDECLLPLYDLQGQHQWGKCSLAASFPRQPHQGNSSGIIHHRLATALIANVIKLAEVLQALQYWGWTRAGWGWVKWGFASLFLKLEHAVCMHMHTCLMHHSHVNLLKGLYYTISRYKALQLHYCKVNHLPRWPQFSRLLAYTGIWKHIHTCS